MKTYVVLCLCVCLYLTEALDDPESIAEENNILILTKNNFRRALRQHDRLLVHFCEYINCIYLGVSFYAVPVNK